jgi:transposase
MGRSRGVEQQSAEMLTLLARHEIQVLRKAGFSVRDVAARTGVSIDSVRRVDREAGVTHVDDRAERRERRIGRPSTAAPFTEKVRNWLATEPELPTMELLRRAKEAGYGGSKTAFYALVAGLRPPKAAPIVRFEGLPGEFSQHDFGQVDVTFVDGRRKRIHFFASRLKYSRFSRVTIVENERVETIVRCLARDFVAFGGRPLMAVFDRPKTVVAKAGRGREVEQFNATFAQAIVDIGVGVEMCAPRSGWQKGSVERLVGWVKGSFFKPRKFLDERDLAAQLEAWHLEVNTKTPSRATGVIPETRRLEELPRLRPVQVFPETLPLRIPVVVGPTAEVLFEGAYYSMPPEAAHVAGTLFLYETRVRIVAGRFESEQRRRSSQEPHSPMPEHRSAKLAAVHGRRAKLYEKRQQVLNLGPSALEILTHLTHENPRRAHEGVGALYSLLDEHGPEALRRAMESVVARGRPTVAAVERALGVEGHRVHEGLGRRARVALPRGVASPSRSAANPRAESKRGGR